MSSVQRSLFPFSPLTVDAVMNRGVPQAGLIGCYRCFYIACSEPLHLVPVRGIPRSVLLEYVCRNFSSGEMFMIGYCLLGRV